MKASPRDVARVFETWSRERGAFLAREGRRSSGCGLTASRRKLIRRAIEALACADATDLLVALVIYVFHADAPWPRWLRGEAEGSSGYYDIATMLRVRPEGRLEKRVDEARAWWDSRSLPWPPPGGDQVSLIFDAPASQAAEESPLAAFRSRRRGE